MSNKSLGFMEVIVKIFVTLIFSILLVSCATNPKAVKSDIGYSGHGKHEVFIVSHGWHTGFVVPFNSISEYVPELKSRFPNASYIEFGWGDEGFYQAREITTQITIKAIFWPTGSVIHAVAVPNTDVAGYFANSDIKILPVTDTELIKLNEFISGSFARNESGVITLKKGIYGNSQFFKGVGSYYLMNTCNKWTAKGLKSMGVDISPTFRLTASSIMEHLDKLETPLIHASTPPKI